MDFDTLINQAWSQHHDDADHVISELQNNVHLVASAGQASRMASIALHLLGGHRHDWKAAADLIERAIGNADEAEGEDSMNAALGSLAAAQLLAGQADAALQSEAHAVQLSSNPQSTVTGIRLTLAEGLAHAGRFEACGLVLKGALRLAEPLDDEAPAVKSAAMVCNNVASELLEKPDRDAEQNSLMLDAAKAARKFWVRAGNWVNEERADYLLALVHNARGEHQVALEAASRALTNIESNGGGERVDQAFLNLQVYAAASALGDDGTAAEALSKADALAEEFADKDGLTAWFQEERAKAVGI